MGQKIQQQSLIGVRKIRSIPRPFPFLFWLSFPLSPPPKYFPLLCGNPQKVQMGCLIFWAFLGQWHPPRAVWPKAVLEFSILEDKCFPMNMACKSSCSMWNEMSLTIRREVSWLLCPSPWDLYSTTETTGLCRTVALLLSSASLELSSYVSRLRTPDAPRVWFACTVCPSRHPSLAEAPASLLPHLWLPDWRAFTNPRNRVQKN